MNAFDRASFLVAADRVLVEAQGDDLVVEVGANRGPAAPLGLVVLLFAVFQGCLALYVLVVRPASWFITVPGVAICGIIGYAAVSALGWLVGGSEEWRFTSSTVTYSRWARDSLRRRREIYLAETDAIGVRKKSYPRRRGRRGHHYEFAVVRGGKDVLVGKGYFPPAIAVATNDALRERLAALALPRSPAPFKWEPEPTDVLSPQKAPLP